MKCSQHSLCVHAPIVARRIGQRCVQPKTKLYIMNLLVIPDCKKFTSKTSPDQDVLFRIQRGENVSDQELLILDCAYDFMLEAVNFLKEINLSIIGDADAEKIKKFIDNVFNLDLIFQDHITIYNLYRLTKVEHYNSVDGVIIDLNFIYNPSVDINKRNGFHGRVNSPDSTCLYLASSPNSAIYEARCEPGDEIVISRWQPIDESKNRIIIYPVNSSDVNNGGVESATNALNKAMDKANEHFARYIKLQQEFLGYHLTKVVDAKHPKRYEYLISSHFADGIWSKTIMLDDGSPQNIGQYEGILYPSVVSGHSTSNIAVRESSIHKLRPVELIHYRIDEILGVEEEGLHGLPINGEVLRVSTSFTDVIDWN